MTFPQYFNDDYDVIGILGKGGMGYVYKAVHKALNREVALKILEASNEESNKRFYLEAQAMKKLDHQNLVQVYDYGSNARQLYIAMTYVRGPTLSQHLKKVTLLDPTEVVHIGKQVARGLKYAHDKGIIHRDIKPSNIIISPERRVYVTDFGISHIQESERLTSTGMAMGTPEYMSPEQCQGEIVDAQSDIYSFGIILYEMITGSPPFTGSKALSIAYKQVHEDPPPPSTLVPNTPPQLEAIVLRCLRKNRLERYPSIADVLDELDQVDGSGALPTIDDATPLQSKSEKRTTAQAVLNSTPSSLKKFILLNLAGFFTLALIFLILFLFHLADHNRGLQFVSATQFSAPHYEGYLEGDQGPKSYPVQNLSDGNLTTAWLSPSLRPDENISMHISLDKPYLIHSLGIAAGYQKALDDKYQDRFTLFAKPAKIILKTPEGLTRTIQLADIRKTQYINVTPFEATEFILEFTEKHQNNTNIPLAISEIRLLGIPLP
jgi:serine/threonine protein kinase